MMKKKQDGIFLELKKRILGGVYTGKLPLSAALAEEFGVNVKTLNKVMTRLVRLGLLERRRRFGTAVRRASGSGMDTLIEVVYEGFTAVFSHPYWSGLWNGMAEGLLSNGFHPVLTRLETDPKEHCLRLDKFLPLPAAGRMVVGIHDPRLFDRLGEADAPYLSVGYRMMDSGVPSLSFEWESAIESLISALWKAGYRRIGFIGQIQTYSDSGELERYNVYRKALQKFTEIRPEWIENATPHPGMGVCALTRILERAVPDVLIVASDTQLPEIERELILRKCAIRLIGCDGVDLPLLPKMHHPLESPLYECGHLAAETIIRAARTGQTPVSETIPVRFHGLEP